MKVKVILGGILLLQSIVSTVYSEETRRGSGSHQGNLELSDNDDDKSIMLPIVKAQTKGTKDDVEDALFLKLHGDIAMGPSLGIEEGILKPKTKIGANLRLKADVPGVLGDKNVKISMELAAETKEVKLSSIEVTLGKYSLGYGSTLFAYEKGNGALPVSVAASIIQFKFEDAFDRFHWGFAVEQAVEVKVGCFDRGTPIQEGEEKGDKKGEEKGDKKGEEKGDKKGKEDDKGDVPKVNQLDADKDKKVLFKLKNAIPVLALKAAIVTDCFHIGLSGLGRLTNYTHDSDSTKNKKSNFCEGSWGLNVGMQYKKGICTLTGQGVYVDGLGDYVSGLAAIQNEEKRKEMCAFYYLDINSHVLKTIRAWGAGGTFEFALTPQWTVSAAAAYLTMLSKEDKPAGSFKHQWQVILPKFTYKLNKHLQFTGNYNLVKESKLNATKKEPIKHTLGSSVKFSF